MFSHHRTRTHMWCYWHFSLTECCRQALLAAAGEMGVSGARLLQLCGEATVDPKTQVRKRTTHRQNKALINMYGVYDLLLVDCAPQETLVAMAKAVASSTAALVANARTVAAKCDDQALQNQVIGAAKATALATQALIACTKVLSPTIDNPLCQEQLIEACKLVAAAVERIVIAAQVGRVLQ